MYNYVWLSRHPLTVEQVEDWNRKINPKDPITKENIKVFNITWEAGYDAQQDLKSNFKTLIGLLEDAMKDGLDGDCLHVLGVFPPVAMEAIHHYFYMIELSDDMAAQMDFYSPVSKQMVMERADGKKPIEFHHVRWANVTP